MPIVMGVLMYMFGSLVAMLMTVMVMGHPLVPVFVLCLSLEWQHISHPFFPSC